MFDLSVRIEFGDSVDSGGARSGYLGALARADGYRVLAVPAVGDLISVVSLTATTRPDGPSLTFSPGAGPFLRVQVIEHYPVPIRDGAVPLWWDGWAKPGINIVLHSTVQWRRSEDEWVRSQLRAFLAGFAESGWTGSFCDEELGEVWHSCVSA